MNTIKNFTQEVKQVIIDEYVTSNMSKEELLNPKHRDVIVRIPRLKDMTAFGQLCTACIVLADKFNLSNEEIVKLSKEGKAIDRLFNELDKAGEVDKIISKAPTLHVKVDLSDDEGESPTIH